MNRTIIVPGTAAAIAALALFSPGHLVAGSSFLPGLPGVPGHEEGLVAHEWGTFTSLQASNGVSLEGLHHEDELLPDFVHSREKAAAPTPVSAMSLSGIGEGELSLGKGPGHGQPFPDPAPTYNPCHGKGCDFIPAAGTALGVTQKMETPVIYFYSSAPTPTKDQSVRVNVSFPGGLITQWYPEASSFSPPAGQAQAVANGSMQWDVRLSAAPLATPVVDPASVWAPSRTVPANYLSAGADSERFIFYRGLGRFTTPVQIRSETGRGLKITDLGDSPVADAFLIHVGKSGGRIQRLGGLPAHGTLTVGPDALAAADEPMDAYLARSERLIEGALVRSGLYLPEAQAMVNTWKTSYFRNSGLRVLYVLPRQWTDSLLPLEIDPQPVELVRTLVGRIEVMTADEELSLLDRLSNTVGQPDGVAQAEIVKLGRFAEPKLRRVLEVAREQGATAAVQAQITRLLAQESLK